MSEGLPQGWEAEGFYVWMPSSKRCPCLTFGTSNSVAQREAAWAFMRLAAGGRLRVTGAEKRRDNYCRCAALGKWNGLSRDLELLQTQKPKLLSASLSISKAPTT